MESLEAAFRRTVDTAFHQAVAFGTVSLLGTLLSLPLVTVGPAAFGVAHAVVVLTRRGAQHGVGEAASLFAAGVRENGVAGVAASVLLFALGAVVVGDSLLLASDAGALLAALVSLSLLFTAGIGLAAMHTVGLVACGMSLRPAIGDGVVLVLKRPGATLVQAAVVASLLALGWLTMIGWALLGFAAAVSFSVRATDGLYGADAGPL